MKQTKTKTAMTLMFFALAAFWALFQAACGDDDDGGDDIDSDSGSDTDADTDTDTDSDTDTDADTDTDTDSDSDTDADTDTDSDSASENECGSAEWGSSLLQGNLVANYDFNVIYDQDQSGTIDESEMTPAALNMEGILCLGYSSAVILLSERT